MEGTSARGVGEPEFSRSSKGDIGDHNELIGFSGGVLISFIVEIVEDISGFSGGEVLEHVFIIEAFVSLEGYFEFRLVVDFKDEDLDFTDLELLVHIHDLLARGDSSIHFYYYIV